MTSNALSGTALSLNDLVRKAGPRFLETDVTSLKNRNTQAFRPSQRWIPFVRTAD